MNETVLENGVDDDIELVRTPDGLAWIDARCEGAGARIVEPVEVVEYAVTSCEIGGVEHLRITEVGSDDASAPATDRTLCSSNWYDLDDVR